ncbi:SDR family oxidoreductase [Sphingomonas ginkgonis]|uniref:SDR family oxidoreductase n=1 Tax=Sphingomonas ginkgonis TaxID=2315330 RepID=A0A429V764_9SPHN|nr:SDR family oxidoreductase [Sphingomonas ginkgonis]RST29788.1 SDR family oxidoreductase [Sphingomonas ginkgonis]
MPIVLITGANRGLGLEFARQYAADGWTVIVTAREESPELSQLGVRVEQLDLNDLDQVARVGDRLDGPLDLLVANAGTYGPGAVDDANAAAEWGRTFTVNTIAPYLLARAVLPRVAEARGKLIAISTRMGSIADNSSGGYLAYRSSKTALNMAWRNLALETRSQGVIATMFHPGWVKTRMGGRSAPLEPEESIAGLRKVIAGLGPKDAGEFFQWDGARVPW